MFGLSRKNQWNQHSYHFFSNKEQLVCYRAIFFRPVFFQKRYGIPLAEETWTLYFTLTMSILIIGSILGGFTSKHLLLLFSRKRLLQLCQILNIISLTLMAFVGGFTGSWEVMIFARLICGYTLGIIYGIQQFNFKSINTFYFVRAGGE